MSDIHFGTARNNFLARAICVLSTVAIVAITSRSEAQVYMPDQAARHEGTWLQWPHHYTYGFTYRNRLDATWVDMTRALVPSEKVHIVAYDATERSRITNLLVTAGIPLTNVDYLLRETDDCWVRDNGPVFVYDNNDSLRITDWGFNGWGLDTPYLKDNTVPIGVATSLGLPRVDLNTIVLEGGAIEVDGGGVLMATRSSILEPARNPGLTQVQLENDLTTNLGVTKFIWLDGAPGGQSDITDMHIDGFAMFGPSGTIVTMSSADLAYWGLSAADINTLSSATDINGAPYAFAELPLTAGNVVTTYGFNIGFKGSYVNYYVCNTAVLVPSYNDPNDNLAKDILQKLYPGRVVVGIDVRNLYRNGGMVHCVTQQQPLPVPAVTGVHLGDSMRGANGLLAPRPNPSTGESRLTFVLAAAGLVDLAVYDVQGRRVAWPVNRHLGPGLHEANWDGGAETGERAAVGVYILQLRLDGRHVASKNLVIVAP